MALGNLAFYTTECQVLINQDDVISHFAFSFIPSIKYALQYNYKTVVLRQT